MVLIQVHGQMYLMMVMDTLEDGVEAVEAVVVEVDLVVMEEHVVLLLV